MKAYIVGILEAREDGSVTLVRVGIQSNPYDQTIVKIKTEIPVEIGCFPGATYEEARSYAEDWIKHLADMGHPFFTKLLALMDSKPG